MVGRHRGNRMEEGRRWGASQGHQNRRWDEVVGHPRGNRIEDGMVGHPRGNRWDGVVPFILGMPAVLVLS